MKTDLIPSLWMVAMLLLVAGAVLWLLPAQSEPVPEPACVEHGLSFRGLPGCQGEPVSDGSDTANL